MFKLLNMNQNKYKKNFREKLWISNPNLEMNFIKEKINYRK